mgnify:CR=1 FL=1
MTWKLIGLILLIGLVKKNGIMMVDFAIAAERDERKTPEESIRQAAILRFRLHPAEQFEPLGVKGVIVRVCHVRKQCNARFRKRRKGHYSLADRRVRRTLSA